MSAVLHTGSQQMQTRDLLSSLFLLLNPKEKEILTRRFSLEGNQKETLESIGHSYGVTRERVRQIEALGLSKLYRTLQNNGLKEVVTTAEDILKEHGGVMREDLIISELINTVFKDGTTDDLDASLMRLSLAIMRNVTFQAKSDTNYAYYRFGNVPKDDIKKILTAAHRVLANRVDVIEKDRLVSETQKVLAKKHMLKPAMLVRGSIEVDRRLVQADDGIGLSTWRHICPKNLRDKAYIVLRDNGHPMHFTEIANTILERKFDKKVVTVQAVHNELIRSDKFVLIGRGCYALAEWGYSSGTVSDVIEHLLAQHNRPMTKREIVEGVLSMRDVQEATISLNLQKNDHFVRVGRALYELDLSKKQDA